MKVKYLLSEEPINGHRAESEGEKWLSDAEWQARLAGRYAGLIETTQAARPILGDERADVMAERLRRWARPHLDKLGQLVDDRARAERGPDRAVTPAAPTK